MAFLQYFATGLFTGIVLGFLTAFFLARRMYSPDSERSRDAIRSIAADLIQHSYSTLTEQSMMQLESIAKSSESKLDIKKAEIEGIIKPLNDTLVRYQQQVDTLAGAVKTDYGGIQQSVSALMSAQKEMITLTGELSSSLKNNQQRGKWGELQLKRIAEISGMLDHCDFDLQESASMDEARVRPDMVVRLPGNRTIIVDAKTPISEYMKALEAQSEDERKATMKNYAVQIRDTIRLLAAKSYQEKFQDSVEFVVMFIPGEAFFSAALEADHELIEYSVAKNVVLASPLILISLLKSAAMGWQQYRIDRNREEIVKLGKDLYSRIIRLTEAFAALGKSMNKSVKDYNSIVSTLESRVLVTARKMGELGVGDGKELEVPGSIDTIARSPESVSENFMDQASDQDD